MKIIYGKNFLMITVFLLLLSYTDAAAQDFLGYNYSNNQVAGGMIFNPASIADSRYRVNVNLLSINTGLSNSIYKVKTNSLISGISSGFDNWKEGRDYSKISGTGNQNIYLNLDILGPSFMIDLGKKIGSVGFSSRVRFMMNETGMNNDILQLLGGNSQPADYLNMPFMLDRLRLNIHAFSDYGLTYARTVWENDSHLAKAGITAKYVTGFAGGSIQIDKLNVEINRGISSLDDEVFNKLQGEAKVVYSDGIDALIGGGDIIDLLKNGTSKSFGLDFGVEYEWYKNGRKPATADSAKSKRTPYTLKLSASITDIGSVKYNPSKNVGSYKIDGASNKVSDLDMPDGDSFNDYLDYLKEEGFLSETEKIKQYRTLLPTALRLNVDWNAYGIFYLNVGTMLNMTGTNSYAAKYANKVYLTPRMEYKFLSLYSPFSFGQSFNWGFGINVGAFFIGSSSVLSNLVKSDFRDIDLHFGFAVPIGKKN